MRTETWLIDHYHTADFFFSSPFRFVPALNAAISFAVQRNFAHILFLSLEMNLTPQAFDILRQNFDPETDLVVGAGN
jgi:hypothetical protein